METFDYTAEVSRKLNLCLDSYGKDWRIAPFGTKYVFLYRKPNETQHVGDFKLSREFDVSVPVYDGYTLTGFIVRPDWDRDTLAHHLMRMINGLPVLNPDNRLYLSIAEETIARNRQTAFNS